MSDPGPVPGRVEYSERCLRRPFRCCPNTVVASSLPPLPADTTDADAKESARAREPEKPPLKMLTDIEVCERLFLSVRGVGVSPRAPKVLCEDETVDLVVECE